MDVTPQELRGSEIKEAFRGYHRDEVDDLLERAAVTIENLTRQVQEVGARASGDAPFAQVSRDDAETIQRTLLLAQRAADDAVAEAQARARQILDESEAKAQTLVGDAEANARRIHEGERRRLEAEISDLVATRDRLSADADALEAYASGYRERVRAAIESDLASLGAVIEPDVPRPAISEDPVEPAVTTYAPGPAAEPVPEPAAWDGPATRSISTVEPEPVPHAGEPASFATVSPAPVPPSPAESEWPPPASGAASGPEVDARAPRGRAEATDAPAPAEPYAPSYDAPQGMPTASPFASETPMEAHAVETDSLDDDTFFASLRDAVRDDTPLGTMDDPGESSPFFDDAQPEESSRRFRRR